MQSLHTRKDTATSRRKIFEDKPPIAYYMQGHLPDGHLLAFHAGLGTLSYLQMVEGKGVRLLMQQQFNTSESSLLIPLLENYPHFCPYEMMVASFSSGSVSEKAVAIARERLQKSLDHGTWDHEMRPVRNVLSRTRQKLKAFGMEALSILETGYLLEVLCSIEGDPAK